MKFLLAAMAVGTFAMTHAAELTQIPFKTMDGKEETLGDYAGKAILVVNVASKCGNTPQYAGLEALYRKYQGQGFVILGFPCNDFGGQEPGTNEEIQKFCTSTYDVTFPILAKIHVKGDEQAPLFAALTSEELGFGGPIEWNFGKFVIGRDGKILARFDPRTKPEDPKVVAAIEAALE